jgi:hypothetical protein
MSVIINGTTGITSPSPFVLEGSTSGTITVAAPAVAGTNTQTLVATTGTLAPIVSGTAVTTTSGTSADFTSIPSWVKRITVMFAGVSLSTTASVILIRIGSGSFEATGYVGGFGLSNSSSAASAGANTTGIYVSGLNAAADTVNGAIVITNVSGNLWVAQGNVFRDGAVDAGYSIGSAKTTSGVLDRLQVVLDSTGAFDAGTINILYE